MYKHPTRGGCGVVATFRSALYSPFACMPPIAPLPTVLSSAGNGFGHGGQASAVSDEEKVTPRVCQLSHHGPTSRNGWLYLPSWLAFSAAREIAIKTT